MRQIYLLPLVLLAACGEMPKLEAPSFNPGDYFSVYRVDIRQGNFVTQDMVSQLKPGLTREQVRYVLGTPLVADPFHGNRWDYIYRYDSGKGDDIQQRRLSIYFEDNKLKSVGGDVAAADQNVAAPKSDAPKSSDTGNAPAAADGSMAKPAASAVPQ